jgi:hypothetical protein
MFMYLLVAILIIIALAAVCDQWNARHRQWGTSQQLDDTTRAHEEPPLNRWPHSR